MPHQIFSRKGKKRFGSKMGMQKMDAIPGVPSELGNSAQLAQKAAAQFGETIERVLIKHGKKIAEEQFVVNRIAQSTIDVYAMFVVLSRASRSINNKSASAEHEANIVNLFCAEVSDKNGKEMTGGRGKKCLYINPIW
jgi:very long chain acyl-CoA dehydrogenase